MVWTTLQIHTPTVVTPTLPQQPSRSSSNILGPLLVDAVNDGVFVFDHQHRILYINNAFSQLTGFSVSQAVGRCWQQLQVSAS